MSTMISYELLCLYYVCVYINMTWLTQASMTQDSTYISKILDPRAWKMPWFPPFTQNSGHSVGGDQQKSRIQRHGGICGMAQGLMASDTCCPQRQKLICNKGLFVCNPQKKILHIYIKIPSAGLMTTPKCTLNIKRELIFFFPERTSNIVVSWRTS